jgi:hypothetical protein
MMSLVVHLLTLCVPDLLFPRIREKGIRSIFVPLCLVLHGEHVDTNFGF